MSRLNFEHPNEILDHYLKIIRRSRLTETEVNNFLINALETAYNDLSNMVVGENRSFVVSPEATTKLSRRIQYLMKSSDLKFLYQVIDDVIVISRV